MPALQRAKAAKVGAEGVTFSRVRCPRNGARRAWPRIFLPTRSRARSWSGSRKDNAWRASRHARLRFVRGVTMDTILLLAHVDADGSLAKPAREALTAARSLRAALAGSTLCVDWWARPYRRPPTRSPTAARTASSESLERRLRRPVTRRTPWLPKPSVGKPAPRSSLPPEPRGWCRALRAWRTAWAPRGHSRDGPSDRGRRGVHQPMVLPPAHGGTIRRTQRPWVIWRTRAVSIRGKARALRLRCSGIDVQPPAGCLRTTVSGFLAPRGRANDPAGRRPPVRSRRGLDEGAGRRQGARPRAADLILTSCGGRRRRWEGASPGDLSGEGQSVLPS